MQPLPNENSSLSRDSLVAEIRRQFLQQVQTGIPKYMQLRKAIETCIEDEVLSPGDQIPPEDDLVEAIGISLGTVRRTLSYLAAGGFVTREHGRGTFVTEHRQAIENSWHYRFVASDGKTLLPVFSHLIDIKIKKEHGPWTGTLGSTPAGYVCIKRSFNVDNKFLAYSEFYLDSARFGRILDLPAEQIENVNLKQVLFEQFNTPTIFVRQRLRVQQFPEEIANLVSIKKKTYGMFLEIVAHTYDNIPISHHMIYIPPTEYMIDLSAHNLTTHTVANID